MNRLITFLILMSLVLAASTLFAQEELQTQNVTGEVIDADSEMPLIGATIKLVGSDPVLGITADLDGAFRLEGLFRQLISQRHHIRFQFIFSGSIFD